MLNDEIKMIADHYGFDAQSHMLVEEMGELIQAISKVYRTSHDHGCPCIVPNEEAVENMFEEIADVSICLSQIIYLTDCMDKVNEWREKKIKRQMERILNEHEREMERILNEQGGVS